MATALITKAQAKAPISTISGLTLPTGLTDALLDEMIERASGEILAAFGVDELSDLTSVRQDAAKLACICYTVSEIILACNPLGEGGRGIETTAQMWRRRGTEAIDRAIAGAAAAQPRGSGPPGLNLV